MDAQDFFGALVREPGTLPEEALPLLEELAAICQGTSAKIAVAAILREVLHTGPRRPQSGFYAAASPAARADSARRAPVLRAVPDCIRVEAPQGALAFAIPDFERGNWTRLRGQIEIATVERLLRANERPLSLENLPELRESKRAVARVVGGINDQFPGGRRYCFVESYGDPPRRRGQRRKADPAEENPDTRMFLIHASSWRIESVTLPSLDDIDKPHGDAEPMLTRLFGKPARGHD